MRDDRERLLDIQEAIDNIKKYAVRGRQAFGEDELVQSWVIRQLQILGEAATKISDDFQDRYPDMPWHKIIGMRNILVHDYFGIDVNIIWSIVEKDMPVLERQIKELLKE
jgi:uncharacterized protein with HEPN domain